MADYELTYYDVRGIGEPIRMILSHAGANWKDTRIRFADPGRSDTIEAEIKSKCLFGAPLLLEFEGGRLVQSFTIARFLAQRYGLAGKDDLESARVDEVVDGLRDVLNSFTPVFHEKDKTKKAKMAKVRVENAKSRFLPVFNKLAEQNGGFLVGNALTWADIEVAHYTDNIESILGVQLLKDFPVLQKLRENVYNAKGIKEWVAQRPQTNF